MVNFDSYFLSEVEEGIAAAERDELVERDEVGKLINQRYPG
jgi:predicted transcriptional regulator